MPINGNRLTVPSRGVHSGAASYQKITSTRSPSSARGWGLARVLQQPQAHCLVDQAVPQVDLPPERSVLRSEPTPPQPGLIPRMQLVFECHLGLGGLRRLNLHYIPLF